jgi:site-specific DNA recombinase
MEVALYVRVSTSRQQQQQTIAQQLSRRRDYVATQPEWHVADEHGYRDDGYSGGKLNRPGLDRLRDHAAMAAFERVLSTAPDCLGIGQQQVPDFIGIRERRDSSTWAGNRQRRFSYCV